MPEARDRRRMRPTAQTGRRASGRVGAAPRGAAAGPRGQATVEFALVAVVLLFLLLVVVEVAVLAFDQFTLASAARQGARAGSLDGLSAAAAAQAAQTEAEAVAAQLLSCPLTQIGADAGSAHPGQMTVTLSCEYRPITPAGALAARLGGGAAGRFTLSAEAVEPMS